MDASCYGVLCKMSQDYLMRYPLVIPQGSLGTQENNDMVASSRYTGAKPSIFTDMMMTDFKKGVVPLKETYNGEFYEPVVLPSTFPNAICNGRQAIGISMAHNSLPHNLTEVCSAVIAFIKNNDITIEELMEIIPGPDFPLGNIVINSKEVKTAFATGKSNISIKVRGNYEIDKNKIIFTTIPYRTYRNKIKEQIEKNIDELENYLSDFDDESNVGKNRLIFTVKKGVSAEEALSKLFALTDLQTSLSYNMNYIVNGTPKLCSMKDLIKGYVDHQEKVLIKSTEYDKIKAEKRIHILQGLIAAVDKIDTVIKLIKESESKAAAVNELISFLSIDEIQANAILEMKLGKLTKIDKQELVNEIQEKENIVEECNKILFNQGYRYSKIITIVEELKNKYGDERRTELLNIEVPTVSRKKEVEAKPVVVYAHKNYIKRVPAESIKTSRRNTKGVKSDSDLLLSSFASNTLDHIYALTNKGKMYGILCDKIPNDVNTVYSNLFKIEPDEKIVSVTSLEHSDKLPKYVVFVTAKGQIKKMNMSECQSNRTNGIKIIGLAEGDAIVSVHFVDSEDILLATKNGMGLRLSSEVISTQGRTARGIKGIKLAENDIVVGSVSVDMSNKLGVVYTDGRGKKIEFSEINTQGSNTKGVQLIKDLEIAGILSLNDKDKVLLVGDKTITISAEEIPLVSRTAIGNKLINGNVYKSYVI